MGKLTSTRSGGQGKTFPDAQTINQSQPSAHLNDGIGETSERGLEVSAVAIRESKGISWTELVDKVKAEKAIVATCWHPNATEKVISTNASDVRVLVGKPAYQLSTGEIVKL